jgi:alpha,alpha-trehalose phosphorylase
MDRRDFPDHDVLDRGRFPVDAWALHEVWLPGAWDEDLAADRDSPTDADSVGATLFALANGHIGLRGDGDVDRGQSAFVNGFHETAWIHHPEYAYGLAQIGQTLQAVPDAAAFDIEVEGQIWPVAGSIRESDHRTLDFHTGEVTRTTRWRSPGLGRIEVVTTRLVSLTRAALAVATCAVTPLDRPLEIALRPQWTAPTSSTAAVSGALPDPRRADPVGDGGLIEEAAEIRAGRHLHSYTCRNSNLSVVVGRWTETASLGQVDGPDNVPVGSTIRATTYLAYITKDTTPLGVHPGTLKVVTSPAAEVGESDRGNLADRADRVLTEAATAGLDRIRAEQAAWLADFWDRSDVVVSAGRATDAIQQATRWSLFQLAQVSAQLVGRGIAAKGLTGSGYSGHYFWDTEIYVLPFLTYTDPDRARQVLGFRHAMLPAARRRAHDLDLAGALFPWRTINGEEASAYFPAGTAQFHIDADIAYAAAQYAAVSGDTDYARGEGLDLVVETARLWADLGFYGDDGHFHIHGVTGPDEYSAIGDDNLYTNTLARFNLATAATWAERCLPTTGAIDPPTHADTPEGPPTQARSPRPSPAASVVGPGLDRGCGRNDTGLDAGSQCSASGGADRCDRAARLGLSRGEIGQWRRAAAAMFIPWDPDRRVHPQDRHFLEREVWDPATVPLERRPLLLHYHPLVIYRHQILKQADVVMVLLLRAADFTAVEKQADFAYYDPLTTGDSTLSAVSQAVIAAEVGAANLALQYFHEALGVDLADRHHNTRDGVHIASAAGVWSVLVQGFGGLRDSGEAACLDPRLPEGWDRLEFPLTLAGSRIRVVVEPGSVTLTLIEGPAIDLPVWGRTVRIEPGPGVTASHRL